MNRVLPWFVLCGLIACQGPAPSPPAPETAPAATPAARPDRQVLIASRPAQATVWFEDAQVGQTPMKMLIRGNTNVVLEKAGYLRQAVLIPAEGNPSMIVDLVPAGPAPTAGHDTPQTPAPSAAPQPPRDPVAAGKPAKHKARRRAPADEDQASAPRAQPLPDEEPDRNAVPPGPEPKKTNYTTMKQIKRAVRAGTITRSQYRTYQSEIRRKRTVELEAAEQEYRARRLSRGQYKQRVRTIKLKYEG